MTRARDSQISLDDTPYYHCMARCVRRAFLCGEDSVTGQSYEHRKQWIVERLHELSFIFSIDICAYAILSNHYHAVLHVDREQAEAWDEAEVLERWRRLFNGGALVERFVRGETRTQAEAEKVSELVAEWRERLTDISWFMRCLNESIARQANAEDHCRGRFWEGRFWEGRFWEGRFKSQALLDEGALLTCMAYVDLNPIRAGIAATPETSEFTSIRERILAFAERSGCRGRPRKTERAEVGPEFDSAAGLDEAAEVGEAHDWPLVPFVGNEREDRPSGIPFHFSDYLELVDWTGRAVREDKRGAIPQSLPPILQRLGYSPEQWLAAACGFRRRFGPYAGSVERLRCMAQKLGRHWLRGVRTAPRGGGLVVG